MGLEPMTVTALTGYIKTLLEGDAVLSQVVVRGEVSNYKLHSSGHHYFTLKDEGAVIPCVMFSREAAKLRFRLESGMKVVLYGRIGLFVKSGQYQIYASDIQPEGVGALFVAFEQLKERLRQEGIFDTAHKKPLPRYPRRVALITSPTGAAVQDMIRVLRGRFPLAKVLVCPVKVQGEGSALEIADMLDYVNTHRLADLIITGRGGGSIEDLWAFNEEPVARAIFRSDIPVISAVGHEPDVTIADFAADVRAATPSNAAELAVRDGRQVLVQLGNAQALLTRLMSGKLDAARARLSAAADRNVMRSPYGYIEERRMLLGLLTAQLESAQSRRVEGARRRFLTLAATLDAISPLKVLSRGYSMVSREGKLVKSVKELSPGDRISLKLSDGTAEALVEQTERKKKNG